MRKRAALAAIAALAVGAAGCGSSSDGASASKAPSSTGPEVSPSGDIPDNQAYVTYAPSGAGYSVKVPEGWSRSSAGGAVTFTDKLNSIRLEHAPARAPQTVVAAKRSETPKLAKQVPGFTLTSVSAVQRKAGTAIRTTYLATAKPNAVTGKAGTDAVERYVFVHNAKQAILTLTGPKGADNVDPWRIVTNSLTWSP